MPKSIPAQLCLCGCGQAVVSQAQRRYYVNPTHRNRANKHRRLARTLGPPGPRLEACACGCGTPLPGGTRRRQFINTAHRMRASRRRAAARTPAV